jgi:RNA polymerase sigma-70 factor, ECF subfamily
VDAVDREELARSAAEGDHDAFGNLVAATQTDIWRTCAYLVDRQTADDLAQQTYLRAFRAMSRFRSDAPVLTWLLTIARRVCIAELERRTRAREVSLHLAPEPTSPDVTGGVDVEALLGVLDPQRRAAFVLTQVVGCDYAEAAAICGCPIGTIRSRVARAREQLIAAAASPRPGTRAIPAI